MTTVKADYKDNEHISITGDRFGAQKKEVVVNGSTEIRVDRREFLVLAILAEECRKSDAFLSMDDIVERITTVNELFNRLNHRLHEERMFWPYPCECDVYAAVKRLRTKLNANGGKAELLESGGRAKGYRLTLPSKNVELSLE